jgi:hypothetical protein
MFVINLDLEKQEKYLPPYGVFYAKTTYNWLAGMPTVAENSLAWRHIAVRVLAEDLVLFCFDVSNSATTLLQ